MPKAALYLIVATTLFGSNISVGEEESTIAENQRQQVDNIIVDMNSSARAVVDTVVSDPQKAIDGGCLDGIQGIDLSVMSVDVTDIWGAVYLSLIHI